LWSSIIAYRRHRQTYIQLKSNHLFFIHMCTSVGVDYNKGWASRNLWREREKR
jgi:hypothetical protein